MTKNFLLNIRKSEDGQFYGSVQDLLWNLQCSFIGLDRAILWMKKRMDQELRCFCPEDKNDSQKTITFPYVKNEQHAKFNIRILYREQTTWQGEVTWVETGEKKCFRSALELLNMIDSVFG